MKLFLRAAVSVFSVLSLPASTRAAAETRAALDAKFIEMRGVPEKLLAAQVFYVEITFENTGSDGWGPEAAVLQLYAPAADAG